MSDNVYYLYDSGYIEEATDDEKEMASTSKSIPIIIRKEIKQEIIEDEDEIGCRLCNKVFANPIALRNHAKIFHIEAYESGDPTVWTLKTEKKSPKKVLDENLIKIKTEQLISSMKPTLITTLATSDDIDYIILKSDDPPVKKKKKEEEPKKSVKRPKPVQVITGPFECIEPSPLGADGVCHQMFFSCCAFSSHVRTEHSRRRCKRCQVCERALPSAEPRAHHCATCGDGFDTEDELLEHATQHIKIKKYECNICHKRFTQQGGLQQHMRMHTGDRPYPCTMCPKAFTQKSGLEQHLRTHTKVKPYRCIVCGKCFCQSVHLKQHMRTHTNLAPFQCGICDKRFKQSSHLSYHLKNHNPAYMSEEQRQKYNSLIGQIRVDEQVIEETVDDGNYIAIEPFVYIDQPTEVRYENE